MSKTKNRRRVRIVNPAYQYGLTFRIVGLVVFGMLVSVTACFMLAQNVLSLIYLKYEIPVNDAGSLFLFNSVPIALLYLALVALLSVLLALLIIRYSHRVVGPIFRLVKVVKDMRQGNLKVNVRLRKNDCGHELAEEMNALSRDYGRHIEKLRESVLRLKKTTETLRAGLKEQPPCELKEIETEISSLEDQLAFFKTGRD